MTAIVVPPLWDSTVAGWRFNNRKRDRLWRQPVPMQDEAEATTARMAGADVPDGERVDRGRVDLRAGAASWRKPFCHRGFRNVLEGRSTIALVARS